MTEDRFDYSLDEYIPEISNETRKGLRNRESTDNPQTIWRCRACGASYTGYYMVPKELWRLAQISPTAGNLHLRCFHERLVNHTQAKRLLQPEDLQISESNSPIIDAIKILLPLTDLFK